MARQRESTLEQATITAQEPKRRRIQSGIGDPPTLEQMRAEIADGTRSPETGEPYDFEQEALEEDETMPVYQRRRRRFEHRYTHWAALTCPEKTQLAADLQFEGEKTWLCFHQITKPGPRGDLQAKIDPVFPQVRVKANTGAEAKERYMKVSGIRGTDHEIIAQEQT